MATFSTTVYVKDQLERDSQYFVDLAVDVLNSGFESSDRELDDLPYNLFDSRGEQRAIVFFFSVNQHLLLCYFCL